MFLEVTSALPRIPTFLTGLPEELLLIIQDLVLALPHFPSSLLHPRQSFYGCLHVCRVPGYSTGEGRSHCLPYSQQCRGLSTYQWNQSTGLLSESYSPNVGFEPSQSLANSPQLLGGLVQE